MSASGEDLPVTVQHGEIYPVMRENIQGGQEVEEDKGERKKREENEYVEDQRRERRGRD